MRFEQSEVTRQTEAIAAAIPAGIEASDLVHDNVKPAVAAENLGTRELPVPLPTGVTDAEFFSLLNAGLTDSSDRELLELVPATTDASIRELSIRASTPAASIQPEMQMPKSLPAAVDEQRINKDTSQLARDREVVWETSTEMHMRQPLPAAVNKQQINNIVQTGEKSRNGT